MPCPSGSNRISTSVGAPADRSACQDEPSRRFVGDVGPRALVARGGDLVQPATGPRLEHDPLQGHPAGYCSSATPRTAPPATTRRCARRTRGTPSRRRTRRARSCGPARPGPRPRSSFLLGAAPRSAAPSERAVDSSRRTCCSSRPTSGCRADHRVLLPAAPSGTDSTYSLNLVSRRSHDAPIARIQASASANASVRSS